MLPYIRRVTGHIQQATQEHQHTHKTTREVTATFNRPTSKRQKKNRTISLTSCIKFHPNHAINHTRVILENSYTWKKHISGRMRETRQKNVNHKPPKQKQNRKCTNHQSQRQKSFNVLGHQQSSAFKTRDTNAGSWRLLT